MVRDATYATPGHRCMNLHDNKTLQTGSARIMWVYTVPAGGTKIILAVQQEQEEVECK